FSSLLASAFFSEAAAMYSHSAIVGSLIPWLSQNALAPNQETSVIGVSSGFLSKDCKYDESANTSATFSFFQSGCFFKNSIESFLVTAYFIVSIAFTL